MGANSDESVVLPKNDLITAFERYMDKNGGMTSHYGWYVGVTADPKRRLFMDHKVNEKDDPWIFGPASSHTVAREVERHFLVKGCKGAAGGGDSAAEYVYAYRISWYSYE